MTNVIYGDKPDFQYSISGLCNTKELSEVVNQLIKKALSERRCHDVVIKVEASHIKDSQIMVSMYTNRYDYLYNVDIEISECRT